MIVEAVATMIEFLKPENTGESALKTSLRCSSVGLKVITLAGTA